MTKDLAIPTLDDIVAEAFRRAPKTLIGGVSGGVLGAVLFGPTGALGGLITGGILGFCADSTETQ